MSFRPLLDRIDLEHPAHPATGSSRLGDENQFHNLELRLEEDEL